jgi:hypothetical protein
LFRIWCIPRNRIIWPWYLGIWCFWINRKSSTSCSSLGSWWI